jgi:hypothetical protein
MIAPRILATASVVVRSIAELTPKPAAFERETRRLRAALAGF